MDPLLFVEDDAVIRNAFSLLLNGEGYEVLAVSSAEAALRIAASRPLALVLLDVSLPGMDGIECASRLRATKLEAPIVFLTAFGGSDFVDRALQCNPHAYLVKPISGEQLIPIVRSALTMAAAEREQQARMQDALTNSRTISAAVGILMERHAWSQQQAFNGLRLMARSESRPIVQLAEEVVSRLR